MHFKSVFWVHIHWARIPIRILITKNGKKSLENKIQKFEIVIKTSNINSQASIQEFLVTEEKNIQRFKTWNFEGPFASLDPDPDSHSGS